MPSDQTTPRAPMRPVEFVADCPACERPSHVDGSEWEQVTSGAFAAHGPGRWPVCECCKTQFEVVAVQVVPADAHAPEVARLRDAHAQLDAWAQSEIGRLKAVIRVNALRWAPHLTHAEIDEVIHGKR